MLLPRRLDATVYSYRIQWSREGVSVFRANDKEAFSCVHGLFCCGDEWPIQVSQPALEKNGHCVTTPNRIDCQ